MKFEKMWQSVKEVPRSHHVVYVGKDGIDYNNPFAALSPNNKTIAGKWWKRWNGRPDAGKEKARRGVWGIDSPPHP